MSQFTEIEQENIQKLLSNSLAEAHLRYDSCLVSSAIRTHFWAHQLDYMLICNMYLPIENMLPLSKVVSINDSVLRTNSVSASKIEKGWQSLSIRRLTTCSISLRELKREKMPLFLHQRVVWELNNNRMFINYYILCNDRMIIPTL